MKMVEFATAKGAAVWVSPEQVLYVSAAAGAGGGASMYGANNVSTATRLHFGHGEFLDVQEAPADVVSRLNG
jgi:hypothetical protein